MLHLTYRPQVAKPGLHAHYRHYHWHCLGRYCLLPRQASSTQERQGMWTNAQRGQSSPGHRRCHRPRASGQYHTMAHPYPSSQPWCTYQQSRQYHRCLSRRWGGSELASCPNPLLHRVGLSKSRIISLPLMIYVRLHPQLQSWWELKVGLVDPRGLRCLALWPHINLLHHAHHHA